MELHESEGEAQIGVVDLSSPNCKNDVVKALEETGFCKVINHGVPAELIREVEDEALGFFNLPPGQKATLSSSSSSSSYGNKLIGRNGDVGWLEYLLFPATSGPQSISSTLVDPNFSCAMNNYVVATKKMACRVLEELAEGLHIDKNDAFSRMLMDEESDSCFRLNHYPPLSPELEAPIGKKLVAFGEHTDPHIISVLRSNDVCGLQILARDGKWFEVPSDPNSFFVIVGDSLQVMSNGRFKSVRHRVVTQGKGSRISMVYFGGPPLSQEIAPIRALMREGEERLYTDFTWREYKMATYKSRLADHRLGLFELSYNTRVTK